MRSYPLRNKTIASQRSGLFFVFMIALLSAIGCAGGKTAGNSPNPGPTPTPTPVSSSPSLAAVPSSLNFGSEILNTPMTLTVKVTNTGSGTVAITQDSITGSGFSVGITTPISLSPAQSVNVPVVFTPSGAGTVTGNLSFSSNGTSLLAVPLSGTGLAPLAHSVDVAWDPSTSATLQGYNVYRSGVSGGPYTRLSPMLSPTTLLFTDTTPLSGQKYFYVVTAVDTSGAESAASVEVAVTIPVP
jgi:hypothetical protein